MSRNCFSCENPESPRETRMLRKALLEKDAQVENLAVRLRRMANKLSRAERDERLALSALLHDHIQPLVVGARMQIWELQRRNQNQEVSQISAKIEGILVETLGALRSLSVELSPAALQNNGLKGGLNFLKSYMADKFHFSVNLTIYDEIDPIEEETSFLLYEGVKELLLNTVKHAGVDSADIYVQRTSEHLISLVVEDQGKGFDTTIIEQPQSGTTTLGLFSIQERLSAIDGRMIIEAAVDGGTRVTLTAPASRYLSESEDGTGRKHLPKEAVQVRKKAKGISILIVDDHSVMRQGLRGLLQTEPDFTVLGEAESGAQGIEMALEHDPDVILMDINLGDMSGIDATRQILSRRPGIRVIGLSMYEDEGFGQAMRKAGAADYLTKHASSDQIISSVRKAAQIN